MSFSHSKVDCYLTCKYKYKLRYIDKLKTRPNRDYNNPMLLGLACHTGIEKRSIEEALNSYKSNYLFITRDHEIEMLKLTETLKKAIEQIPEGEYEKCLSGEDGFIGYIDCLVPVGENEYDLLDFKYSNNVSKYRKSSQVHVYKYYFEQLTEGKIRNIYYVMIPKYTNKDSKRLSDQALKEDITGYFKNNDIRFEKIEYDPDQVKSFLESRDLMFNETSYDKCPSDKCTWCEYFKYCKSDGADTSELEPKKEEKIEPVSLF